MTQVSELEQKLKSAVADEDRKKRAEAVKRIEALSADGSQLRAAIELLAAQINAAQQERLRCHGELVLARNQINTYSAPLDPLTFPSELDEHNHVEQLALWKKRQQDLLELHADCIRREGVRPQAVQLQRRLQQVTFEIQNLTAVAEGRRPGTIEGGVSMGVEDFIGSSQVGPPRS